MVNSINGFKCEEIFQLYALVKAYEVAGIKSYQTQTSLFRDHPEAKELLNVLSKVKCHCTRKDMTSIDFKRLNNEIYFTEYHVSNLLSLLYHLRNSIAHANAVKDENSVLVIDYKVKRPTDFSARGRIEMAIINGFTEVLKKFEL